MSTIKFMAMFARNIKRFMLKVSLQHGDSGQTASLNPCFGISREMEFAQLPHKLLFFPSGSFHWLEPRRGLRGLNSDR